MASEDSAPDCKAHAGMQLELCLSKLDAVAACRADLNARQRLLDAKERLIKAEQDFWQQEAELQDMKHSCDYSAELSPATKKRRDDPDAASPEQPESSLVEALATAKREARDAASSLQACEEQCTAMEADIRNAVTMADKKKWELRAFAREHGKAEAQLVPHEMLREIFSYLQLNDRVTAGQVCSTWREVAKSDISLWRDTKLTVVDCRQARSIPQNSCCRILAANPYVHELRVLQDHKVVNSFKIRKLIIPIGPGAQAVLRSHFFGLPGLSALSLVLNNHEAARLIDSRCVRLTELFVKYKSLKPFYFTSNFVIRSTLIDLRCCDIPFATLKTILAGHHDTLKRIALIRNRAKPKAVEPCGTIDLTGCLQLKWFQVDCRMSFSLPPSCEEVQLVVCLNKQHAAPCEGCVSLSGCAPGSGVTRLHLIAEFVSVRDVALHLIALDRGWLAALHKVSIFCRRLTEAKCGEIASVLGRSLDLARPEEGLIGWEEF